MTTDDEGCWYRAFAEVLGVGLNFYAGANDQRRRWLEQHYRELATHDTPKGRKAAKVVAKYVQYSLQRGERTTLGVDFARDQIDAYKYMFEQARIRETIGIRGKQASMIIVDDLDKL